MIILDHVIQGKLKRKELLVLTAKACCVFAFIWAGLFYMMLLTGYPYSRLNSLANGVQLLSGLSIGLLVLWYARYSRERYLVLGVGLAIMSWTLGQLYWFSFIFLGGESIPYPSVAELGYIGTYFLLIGVIKTITNRIPKFTIQIKLRNLWPMVLLLVPTLLALGGTNRVLVDVVNFTLILAVVYILWIAQPIFQMIKYRVFILGIILLCVSDILFIVCACCIPDAYTLSTDALFPVALSLTAYGFMKAEEVSDG